MLEKPYTKITEYMLEHIYVKTYIIAMDISASDFFASMANPIRLRCLVLLVQEDELCVCELMYALGLSQPMISRHLAQLRKAGLVHDRREGQWIYYRLQQELPVWVTKSLQATVDGIKQLQPYATDHETLNGMPNRPGATCCA